MEKFLKRKFLKTMRPLKLKIPKKLLKTPLLQNLSLWLLSSLILAFVFIALSLVEGASFEIKKNIIRNYNSHLSIKSPNYNKNTSSSLESWWNTNDSPLDLKKDQPYVRAFTKRSVVPVIYSNNTTNQALQLTIIQDGDSQVFDNFMFANKDYPSIPIDTIFIGKDLAQKLNLSLGDPFPISFPQFKTTLTNMKIGYIFESPYRFYNNYGAFINEQTAQSIISNSFQQYHVRFAATPFIHLNMKTLEPLISGHTQAREDDLLTYPYKMLSLMTKNIQRWAYLIYAIFGLLFFFIAYFSYFCTQNDLDMYTNRTGIIPPLKPYGKILGEILKNLIIMSIGGLGFLILFLMMKFPFNSHLFTSPTGIFQNYSLPIPYVFHPSLPLYSLIQCIPLGISLGFISGAFLMFIYSLLPNFLDPKKRSSYTSFAMILVLLCSSLMVHSYLIDSFALKSRENFWTKSFYGSYNLFDKNYLDYKFLDLAPPIFSVDPDLLLILQEQDISYIASLERYGVASTSLTVSNIESTLKKDVSVKSLTGIPYSFYNKILPALASNQVLVGANIASYFNNAPILGLSIEGKNTQLIIQDSIDIPYGDFNNSIFINQATLAKILNISPYHITKLQVNSGEKYLKNYTNEQLTLVKGSGVLKSWNILANLTLTSAFIYTILFILWFMFLIMFIFLYYSIRDKQALIIYHRSGIPYQLSKSYSFICLGSIIMGIFFSWITKLIFLIYPRKIPEFLEMENLVPKFMTLSVDFSSLLFLVISCIIIAGIIVLIYFFIFKKAQKNIVHNHYKNQNS